MAAEQICHRPPRAPLDEPVNRPDEARPVEDVQPTWVDGVAGEKDPAIAVVVGDGSLMVPGSCQAIENPAAEIDFGHRLGFVGEAEVRLRSVALGADYRGVGPVRELAVSSGVVGMRMRMKDEQPVVSGMRLAGQPAVDDRVHGAAQRKELGSGVAPVSIRTALEPPKRRNMNGAS
jgi:hypothetical protein